LKGALLRAQVELFESYDLRTPEQALGQLPAHEIPGLRLLDGFQCLTCSAGLTRHLPAIERHVSKAHQQKPAQQVEGRSWRRCKLQTFFAEKQYLRYFTIAEADRRSLEGGGERGERDERDKRGERGEGEQGLSIEEKEFFRQQDADVEQAGQDATIVANTVHGFESHRSAVVPWLDRRTGIAECVRGLDKD
jgi:hypothetical protein